MFEEEKKKSQSTNEPTQVINHKSVQMLIREDENENDPKYKMITLVQSPSPSDFALTSPCLSQILKRSKRKPTFSQVERRVLTLIARKKGIPAEYRRRVIRKQ